MRRVNILWGYRWTIMSENDNASIAFCFGNRLDLSVQPLKVRRISFVVVKIVEAKTNTLGL